MREETTVIGIPAQYVAALPLRSAATFRYDVRGDTWDCSDEFARLFGYPPGQVVFTSELVLAHRHPDERAEAAAIVDRMQDVPGTYVHSHRLVRADGQTRTVVAILRSETDSSGRLIGIRGDYVDADDLPGAARTRTAQEAELETLRDKIHQLEIAIRSRDVIGQAKGMIMLATGRSDEEAFATLVQLSQATNVKLRDLAGEVVQTLGSDPRLAAEIKGRGSEESPEEP